MEFALSSDQKMLQDSVTRTLARLCPLDRVRKAAEAKTYAQDVWQGLVELGIPGLLIPEKFGGVGLKLLDAALVAEALGHHVSPVPFIASCVMAPLALLRAASPAQQAKWLPRLASGEITIGVAISEQVAGAREGAGIAAQSERLNGKAIFALDFAQATLFIVADQDGKLHLVDATAPGVHKTTLTTIDLTRSIGELHVQNVESEPLAHGDGLIAMRDAGWIMLAADTLGASWQMIEKSVTYAQERKQFDRVIGSFQAVKHLCAEMAAELEPGRALIWYAAHAFDDIPSDASLTAAHAKAYLSEVGRFVARTSTEVHGGIGITDLLGLHYWFKRIGLNRQLLGGPERVRHLAAQMQGFI